MLPVLVVATVVVVGPALVLAHVVLKRASGRATARHEIVRASAAVTAAAIIAVAVFELLPRVDLPVAALGLVVLMWLMLSLSAVTWYRDRARAGEVLLSLGRAPEAKFSLVVVALSAVSLSLQLVIVLSGGKVGMDMLTSILVMSGLLTQAGLQYAVTWKYEIREHGILAHRLLRWDEIQRYRWEEATSAGRRLRFFLQRPRFFTRTIAVTVPFAHRDAADRVLRLHIGSEDATA